MRAFVLTGYGGPEVAELREVSKPRPAEGEVLVRVHAAGLNPVDFKTREGKLKVIQRYSLPKVMGNELAAAAKERGGRCDIITAMAKMYASDCALEIAHQAVVVHGGAGYIQDYVVERLHREALLYTIGEGTNDINRIVISRRMKGEEEMQYLGLVP